MNSRCVVVQLIEAAQELSRQVARLRFAPPITHVYNPLDYAWEPHEQYLRRYGNSLKRVVFLGMNPGPFGMAQTGVPFGEIKAVRDWMGIEAPVRQPRNAHPARPVQGFACPRSEVSGRRLWHFFASRYGTPDSFFSEHFVLNYCPLVFMEESGRNRTPAQLTAREAAALFKVCDAHLLSALEVLKPEWAVGVGDFAAERLRNLSGKGLVQIGQILHPSPASPVANRDWAGTVARQLLALGVWK